MGDSFTACLHVQRLYLFSPFIYRRCGIGMHNVITKIYHMSVITLISRKICDKLSYLTLKHLIHRFFFFFFFFFFFLRYGNYEYCYIIFKCRPSPRKASTSILRCVFNIITKITENAFYWGVHILFLGKKLYIFEAFYLQTSWCHRGFQLSRLQAAFRKFYGHYNDLIYPYNLSLGHMCPDICFKPIVNRSRHMHWSWLRFVSFTKSGNGAHGGCDR
jgi:hypothetical protein